MELWKPAVAGVASRTLGGVVGGRVVSQDSVDK
jgi:hypothetical protein